MLKYMKLNTNKWLELDSLFPHCAKKDFQIIAFNIGSETINSFNVFINIYMKVMEEKNMIFKHLAKIMMLEDISLI